MKRFSITVIICMLIAYVLCGCANPLLRPTRQLHTLIIPEYIQYIQSDKTLRPADVDARMFLIQQHEALITEMEK